MCVYQSTYTRRFYTPVFFLLEAVRQSNSSQRFRNFWLTLLLVSTIYISFWNPFNLQYCSQPSVTIRISDDFFFLHRKSLPENSLISPCLFLPKFFKCPREKAAADEPYLTTIHPFWNLSCSPHSFRGFLKSFGHMVFVFNLLNLNCSWEDGVLKFLFLSVFKLLQFWPVGPSSMFKIHFWVFLNCSFLVYVAIGYNKICLAYYMESVIPWRILDSFLLGNNISRLQGWE